MRRVFLAMMICLSGILCAAETEPPEVPSKPLVLSQAWDILDSASMGLVEMGCNDGYMTKEHLRMRMRMAKDAGMTKLYFRATGGVVYYPNSKFRKTFKGMFPHNAAGARTFAEYDILAEFIKAAHELGMQVHYWETPFDCYGEYHFPKGTPECDQFGEWPFRDTSIRDEHHAEHRFAAVRPPEGFKRPVKRIVIRTLNVPDFTADKLVLLTAPHGGDYTPYTKPFTLTIHEVKDQPYKAEMILDGLEVTNPCVKVRTTDEKYRFAVNPDVSWSFKAIYDNDEEAKLFTVGEVMLQPDKYPELVREGVGGFGYSCYGNYSLIIRFGDFRRYAIGVPEYAYEENRMRMRNLVRELYELYPELDGVTFSLRTHSLPCGGKAEMVGTPIIYGYSEPVVREFIRRYGVDPRRESFNEELFLKLRGEYFTQMLEGVAKIVHEHGGKLECMAPIKGAGNIAHGSMYPWYPTHTIDNFFDIRTWAQKGIVDNVIMLGTQHRQKEWGPSWKEAVQRFAAHLEGTKTRLTLHFLVNADIQENMAALLTEILREEKLDEVESYEEWNMSVVDKLYPRFTEVVKASGRPIVPPAEVK